MPTRRARCSGATPRCPRSTQAFDEVCGLLARSDRGGRDPHARAGARPDGQRLAGLSDALLPAARRARRSTSPGGAFGFRDQLQDAARPGPPPARADPGADPAARRPPVRRGRRAALVASASGPRRPHPLLGRSAVAAVRGRRLRREHRRSRAPRRDGAFPQRPPARRRRGRGLSVAGPIRASAPASTSIAAGRSTAR